MTRASRGGKNLRERFDISARFQQGADAVLQMRLSCKKSVVLYSIRLSPEVYARTLTVSRLGVLSKKI